MKFPFEYVLSLLIFENRKNNSQINIRDPGLDFPDFEIDLSQGPGSPFNFEVFEVLAKKIILFDNLRIWYGNISQFVSISDFEANTNFLDVKHKFKTCKIFGIPFY